MIFGNFWIWAIFRVGEIDAASLSRVVEGSEQNHSPPESMAINKKAEEAGKLKLTSDDTSLLSRYRRGDDDAATALYVKYAARLRRIAAINTSNDLKSRFDAEDVVQSVFRTFFRRASEGYFDVPDGDEIWNLFLVIALNKIRELGKFHRRQRRNVKTTESANERSFETLDSEPLTTLQISIDEVLNGLSPAKRTMVEMRLQGHDIDEIASETNRCTRTIERTLRKFRELLARQIRES